MTLLQKLNLESITIYRMMVLIGVEMLAYYLLKIILQIMNYPGDSEP